MFIPERNPNTMFIFGTYGALAAAVAKLATLDPRANRPRANYYEVVEARKRAFHQEVRDGEAKDGYIHRWLDPQVCGGVAWRCVRPDTPLFSRM